MQKQILAQYRDIMGKLATLPREIAQAQDELAQAKMTSGQTDKTLSELEVKTIQGAGGWAGMGKNDGDRKNALANMLTQNSTFRNLTRTQDAEAQAISDLTIEVDYLTRVYGAVCYQARLLASLMSYLGNAGAPVEGAGDIEFMAAPLATNGSNGHVTVADAEAIGL